MTALSHSPEAQAYDFMVAASSPWVALLMVGVLLLAVLALFGGELHRSRWLDRGLLLLAWPATFGCLTYFMFLIFMWTCGRLRL